MALANTIDPEAAADPLAGSLARNLGARDVDVRSVSIPAGSGMSNQTVMFDASWKDDASHPLVARVIAAPEAGLFMTYDAEREHRLLEALGREGSLPVPGVHFVETDPSLLGAPFIVMDRIEGRTLADDPPFTAAGWALELDPAARATLFANAIEALAKIHAIDWRALDLGFLNEGESALGPLENRIAYEKRFYAWVAEGRAYPVIDSAFEWLDGNRPDEEGELVLNWGDPRVSNVVFGDDLEVRAVLDWEMASVSSFELDLGWWRFGMRHHTEGIGVPLPDGFPDDEAFLGRYSEISGRVPEHLDFYEVLAGVRGAIMMVRAAGLMVQAGFLPADTPMFESNPASQLLAVLIGAPPPSGESESFIGNRGE